MSEDLVAMARAAENDDRLADGALYGKLADEIERLRDCRRILERIAGGDGYYPELARTCLHMTEH